METSLPLASDSFSYSWLSNSKPPHDTLEDQLHRESECNQSFNFDTSISHSPNFLVHADEIFSDGFLMPVSVDPLKVEFCNITPDPIQTKNGSSSFSASIKVSSRKMGINHKSFLTRWRKSTWRALVEFFSYFNTLKQKIGSSRKNSRVDNNTDKTDWQVRNLSSSSQKELHDDHENSISEAVLHCKRSKINRKMIFS